MSPNQLTQHGNARRRDNVENLIIYYRPHFLNLGFHIPVDQFGQNVGGLLS